MKTPLAIASFVLGVAGFSFGAGQTIVRATVEAKVDAHTAPGTIHPEAAKRIDDLRGDVREAAKQAGAAAEEARETRRAVERMAGSRAR